jgi:hypothetical protein
MGLPHRGATRPHRGAHLHRTPSGPRAPARRGETACGAPQVQVSRSSRPLGG